MINEGLSKRFIKAFEDKNYTECIAIGEWFISSIQKKQENAPELADMLFSVSCAYMKVFKIDRAIELLNKALEINQKVEALKSKRADILNNLAIAYSAKEDNETALFLHKEVLSLRSEKNGETSAIYADSLYNIGNCFLNLGNFDEAAVNHKKALKVRRDNNHPIEDIIDSINCLGYCFEEKKDFETSLIYLRKALALSKKQYTEAGKPYIIDLCYIAAVYFEMCDYKMAASVYEKAARLIKKNISQQHLFLIDIQNRLAECYENLSEYEKAVKAKEKAVSLFEQISCAQHLTYANNLIQLARLYKMVGKGNKSPELVMKSMAIKEKLIGKDNFTYLKDVITCCIFLIESKEYAKCMELIQSTLNETVSEDNSGFHPEMQGLLELLAGLKDLGDAASSANLDGLLKLFDSFDERSFEEEI